MTRFFFPINVLNVTGVINSPTIGIKPLTFTAVGLGDVYISLTPTGTYEASLDYSRDGGKTWTHWDFSSEPTITLPEGASIAFRGVNNDGARVAGQGIGNFGFAGNVTAEGSVMSLIYGQLLDSYNNLIIPDGVTLTQLFANCTGLLSAPELPALKLSERCYDSMFSGCTGLTEAPYLPATELVSDCYAWMFTGCTYLSEISVAFTDWHGGMTQWVDMVDPGGVFKCPAALDTSIQDSDHVPVGWTVENI